MDGGLGRDVCAELRAVAGTEPLVAADEGQHAARLQQLQGTEVEEHVEVGRAGVALSEDALESWLDVLD